MTDGWQAVQDLNRPADGGGHAAVLAEIDAAYLPSLLCRVGPFERWVITELHAWPTRTADDVGADCGLPAWRVTEIAERAVGKMRRMQGQGLGAD